MQLNILVINQNDDFCGNVCRFLSSEGQKPICSTTVTAIQKAVELHPDAIVVEISMPELNSIEIVNQLQRSSSTRNIPVIVISDFPELEYELLHLFDFICKPVDLRRLREDIGDISAGMKKRSHSVKQQLTADEHKLFHDFLIRHCGLHFERRNIKMLERGLDSRMTALRMTSYGDYYDYLELNIERRNELQKLLQFLTVGETFFFRYHGHFESVAKNALADLLQPPANKSLRIWSAGCSTGEEPYSIAMAIMEAIPDWKKRDIRIFATDINSRSLKRAKEGVFSSWKMRVTPKHYIEKYFKIIGESYLVKDEVKSLVDFSYFNLQAPPPHTGKAFDIIFCRNVLIYFTTATTKEVVEKFADSLNPGGYLYLGHSETMMNISTKFERHIQSGSFYYRKKAVTVLEPQKRPVTVLPRNLQSVVNAAKSAGLPLATPLHIVKPLENINPDILFNKGLALFHREKYAEAAAVMRETLLLQSNHTGAILAEGQIQLAQGEYDGALDRYNAALTLNDLLPEGYFLRGLLFEVTDQVEAALQEYRKAVLLKIDFIMPHYQLGKLCFRIGDTKTSVREIRNSVRLLEKTGREWRIPFSGGLTREVFLEQAQKDMTIVESALADQKE